MKRLLFVALALFANVSASHAVTLGMVSDKTVYFFGETVTLTIFGGDGGASSYGVFGRLDYSGALVDNGTRSQSNLGGWTKGVLLAGDNGTNAFSDAFNQISGLVAQTSSNLPDNFYIPFSTVTLIGVGLGVVNVSWHTALDGFGLSFFGLTNAPGTSFTIIDCTGNCTVPEPTTGALLALGLVALTARSLIRARRPIDPR